MTPPAWGWAVYAGLFGVASLRALWSLRRSGHHLHHLVGSSAMVYMALTMAPGVGAAHGGHTGHGVAAAGGVPLLTGLLLAYYAVYVLWSGSRLIPATAGGGGPAGGGWSTRPELALACRLRRWGWPCSRCCSPCETADGQTVVCVTCRAQPYPWVPRPS